jgi:hypothetical protein
MANGTSDGKYVTDRNFADKYISKQRDILAPVIGKWGMNVADFETDTKQATDLTWFLGHIAIGARIRRSQYRSIYGLTQFTMRVWRATGALTEYFKITQQQHGDWFFYSHAADDSFELPHWLIIDLHAFRRYHPALLSTQGHLIRNKDNSTAFRAWDVRNFPVGVLIAASKSVLDELEPGFAFATVRRINGDWDPGKIKQ